MDVGLPGQVAEQVIEQLQKTKAAGQCALRLVKRVRFSTSQDHTVCVSICQETASPVPTYLLEMQNGFIASCTVADSVARVLEAMFTGVGRDNNKHYELNFADGTFVGYVYPKDVDEVKAVLKMMADWKIADKP